MLFLSMRENTRQSEELRVLGESANICREMEEGLPANSKF